MYVARSVAGRWYVGESDDLYKRLAAHRAPSGKLGPEAEVAFIVAPNKSAARRIEKEAMAAMERAGMPMESAADARHRNFGDRQ